MHPQYSHAAPLPGMAPPMAPQAQVQMPPPPQAMPSNSMHSTGVYPQQGYAPQQDTGSYGGHPQQAYAQPAPQAYSAPTQQAYAQPMQQAYAQPMQQPVPQANLHLAPRAAPAEPNRPQAAPKTIKSGAVPTPLDGTRFRPRPSGGSTAARSEPRPTPAQKSSNKLFIGVFVIAGVILAAGLAYVAMSFL